MNDMLRQYYLTQLNIDIYKLAIRSEVSEKIQEAPLKESIKECAWEALETRALVCTQCKLCTTRTQVVFGTGSKTARIMLVGEAPGFYEDKQGEPFVGRAGQLLNAMLLSIGVTRHEVYIANVIKCRPPENRDPMPDEVAACSPFLEEQIQLIAPKCLVALGRHAAHRLLQTTQPLNALRGKWHHSGDIPVRVSYHPAYLLRNPRDKARAYKDWVEIKRI